MTWLSQLEKMPLIAVIRASTFDQGYQMATCALVGGLTSVEITWTTPRAAELVQQLHQAFPAGAIGVGTIRTEAQLSAAVAAGAAFAFAPHTDVALIQRARSLGLPMVPGAMTPTEIVTAWQAGATAVKVFPIQAVGGAAYLRAIAAPLGQIPLIPTGGVTLEQTPALLKAGAIAVGLGSQLFPAAALAGQDWAGITEQIRQGCDRILDKNFDG
ncbi:MAG: bifunctional 4-hydroxy-2-oxoglutarate aldolase/2-dehydro-3-deoxy-phosphogluconate aldolase [Cyanobacteria bacterium P01_G01_bin.54]